METTRPIRALTRGLDALTVLNLRSSATVSEIAHDTRLPRTTVYRILETLCNAGFVYRDAADDRYRLTVQVRDLSAGFGDESWVRQIARPCIVELGREIVWPVSVATLSGTDMTVRETTDHTTPLATERFSAGFTVPLLTSSAGRVYLAFCPATERDGLLARASRSPHAPLDQALADIKARGYASVAGSPHLAEEISLSVPVMADDRILAALSVRFVASALAQNAAIERFFPKLRASAAKIALAYFQQAAPGAQATAAPSVAS